jgi:hypothetical protein
MTIGQLQAIAKEKYGKEVTDEQAERFLADNDIQSEEELENAASGMVGCGDPGDPVPSVIEGTTIRYLKLDNEGGFVAQMRVPWELYENITDGGNIVRKLVSSGTYEQSGYHDICLGGERTIDLNDTGIPDGAEVYLEVVVVAGRNRLAGERFHYGSTASDNASYKITGTTFDSSLRKV